MDLSSAVQWWDEWQLRILVLGSLGLQWFLLVAAPMRRFAIPFLFRISIWLAYLSSDALAIYALATLFNRHAKATTTNCGSSGSTASVLEVLWAPVLLIHLGGREEITAYNIEDNELWRRHAITLVSQVTVALYAFCKSWPSSGEKRLLAAAILLFIIGVFSFLAKPWALKQASISSLVAVSSKLTARGSDKGSALARCLEFCFTDLRLIMKKRREKKEATPFLSEADRALVIFADMSLLAADHEVKRQSQDAGVLQLLSPRGYQQLQNRLHIAFKLLYTRANVIFTPAYVAWHLLLLPSLHIAVITLFARSHKHGQYNGTDVKVTYILLCCTAALDVLAMPIRVLLFLLMSIAGVPALCETVAQYNLVSSVLQGRRPIGSLMKCIGYKDVYAKETRLAAQNIVGYVTVDLIRLGDDNIKGLDVDSYRRFDVDNWALGDELKHLCGDEIRRSLQKEPFDRSVLLWHIATDLCFRRTAPADMENNPCDSRQMCIEAISNYMVYLLNFRPDMLMTGSRQHLFTEASTELESIFKGCGIAASKQPLGPEDPKSLADIIREACKPADDGTGTPYYLTHDACKLSDALMYLQDKMWEVMERVWVGMLCYSASMCRGYLHAKSLGEGGEFLSAIWLLLANKGVQTLADKLQMSAEQTQEEHPCRMGMDAAVAASAAAAASAFASTSQNQDLDDIV